MPRTWTEEDLRIAVRDSTSIAQALAKLSLRPAGGNYKQFNQYVKEYCIDISHFSGQAWNRGKTYPVSRASLAEQLVAGSKIGSDKLRRRLLRAGVFDPVCSSCGLSEWMGGKIPLELEHKNGVSDDNRVENLCLLCPNCHALTSTYRGKNIRR